MSICVFYFFYVCPDAVVTIYNLSLPHLLVLSLRVLFLYANYNISVDILGIQHVFYKIQMDFLYVDKINNAM